jgi:hypothetical protein
MRRIHEPMRRIHFVRQTAGRAFDVKRMIRAGATSQSNQINRISAAIYLFLGPS